MIDRDSYGTVQAMRATFDVLSGYKKAKKRGTLGENEVRAGWAVGPYAFLFCWLSRQKNRKKKKKKKL
jgi:hypothetical protein